MTVRNYVEHTYAIRNGSMQNGRRALLAGAAALSLSLLPVMASGAASAPGTLRPDASKAMKIAKGSDCFSCHAIDRDIVGPAWDKVAGRYEHSPEMVPFLAGKIRKGSKGDWGRVPMPAHPQISEADATTLATWILSLKGGVTQQEQKAYTYKTEDGKRVEVDFKVFESDKERKVTGDIFTGFEQYNSYCFRCHGEDAVGGEYAPDLRHSLNNGMTEQGFITVAMEGRKDKGMPSWAGFFSPEQMTQIYQYVKARSLDLVGVGRPPAQGD